MKYGLRIMLVVGIFGIITLVAPGPIDAACYICEGSSGCQEPCTGQNGKSTCTQQQTCGGSGCMVTWCTTTGSNCTGTQECAACSQALEECGIENSGASLIVPHGELPPAGSWLEKKDRELRLCRSTIEQSLDPGHETIAPIRPGRS